MSKKEVFDAEAALDAILEDIELGGWSPRSDFIAEKTGFFHGESKWRTEEKTKPFTDWLQDKAADGEEKKNKNGGLIRVLRDSTSQWESSAFKLLIEKGEKTKELEDLLNELKNVYDRRGESLAEFSIEDRYKATVGLRDALERLEQATDYEKGQKKKRNSLPTPHKKWPLVTALLSFASPRHFPIIRPNNVTHPYVAKRMFEGIEYQTGANPELYREYIERAEAFHGAMERKFKGDGLVPPPTGLRSVSEWWIGLKNQRTSVTARCRGFTKLLEEGRHLILQGPPGTGKTFTAESITSYGLSAQDIEEKSSKGRDKIVDLSMFDPEDCDAVNVVKHFVQFHASFDYEDFVRGFRPRIGASGEVGFALEDGPFAKMVSFAARFPEISFLLVIDEINRADLARVLGECIYLLDRRVSHANEESERWPSIADAWSGKSSGSVSPRYQPTTTETSYEDYDGRERLLSRLVVPTNFHLIGTMNTADRSIAIVDVALRRRFAFIDLKPDPQIAREYLESRKEFEGKDLIAKVVEWMDLLNGSVDHEEREPLIRDARYHIGHAYFMKPTPRELSTALRYQLLPLLEEYKEDGLLATGDDLERLLSELRTLGGGL